MAISRKGFRKIVVDSKHYLWKFNKEIIVVESPTQAYLTIDFGWYDEWLYIKNPENAPPDFKPRSVTPKFVRQGITFAKSHDWKQHMKLKFANNIFTVLQ